MKTYTIKPLVWKRTYQDFVLRPTAKTPFGKIFIYGSDTEFWFSKRDTYSRSFPTLEAAKLAAEEWYRGQIEQALTEVTE